MVGLSLMLAANNGQYASAALSVLERLGIPERTRLSDAVVDRLLLERAGARSCWHRLLAAHSSPRLNELLMAHPRLLKAIASREVHQ
jgi:hypothetical protein